MINYWAIFFLIAAGQGLFLSLLLLLRNVSKNLFLALLISLFSLTIGHYVTFWLGLFSKYPHLIGLSATLPWLFGPTLYLYVKQTGHQARVKRSSVLHFAVFFLHFLYLTPFYTSSAVNKLTKAQDTTLYSTYQLIINWGQTISLLFYAALILYTVLYKSSKSRSKSLLYMSGLFIAFSVSHASYYVMVYGFHYVQIYDYYISASMALFIYWVGYIGFIKPEALDGETTTHQAVTLPANKPAKYAHSALSDLHAKQLLDQLKQLMQTEKPYLNPALKMKEIADQMGISGHHLSQILNEYAEQNYADFVNSYRVNEVRQKLRNPQYAQEKIIAIAYDAGFNTKASFNAHFKKQTGLSPSAYKQQFLGETLPKNN
ncbi:helix-turn-helix domain-containing protein [Microscilla marina]|uniref:Transcriptional regulator, AraC family, putative n=1 Tax=Microscilla marina ATCC 23134 TaxID=313606 RepID=A1ZHB7_MICM2|nr:helix-turn-helix domain-containing protein [Microscilla marina]EAY30386.1 transcriptional regulator, AraC family, putative [Microscilla marina ATCC 23134]